MMLTDKAIAQHVSGCGGVAYYIGQDGVPRDVRLVTEGPLGYGYGSAAVAAVKASRYSPRETTTGPHFTIKIYTYRVGPARPSS